MLFRELERVCEGLIYISETDAPVHAFCGRLTDVVSPKVVLQQLGKTEDEPIEEIAFNEFFIRLTTVREWFGEPEIARAKKFLELRELLEKNLSQRKVFKTGRVQVDIFAGGIDRDGCLLGVTTRAVET